jgi:hypothetical protein
MRFSAHTESMRVFNYVTNAMNAGTGESSTDPPVDLLSQRVGADDVVA